MSVVRQVLGRAMRKVRRDGQLERRRKRKGLLREGEWAEGENKETQLQA